MEAVIVVLILALIVPFVFYLITLQAAFNAVSEPNRDFTPGLVWLMFIPIFSYGWYFVVVIKLANALKREYAELGIEEPCSGGFGVGLASAICSILSIIPYLGILAAIAALVLFIIHWVQINGFKHTLLRYKA